MSGGAMLDLACPRCGGGFECGVNAGRCDCFELRLSDAVKARIAADHPGRCLCLRCLRELADDEAAAQDPTRVRASP